MRIDEPPEVLSLLALDVPSSVPAGGGRAGPGAAVIAMLIFRPGAQALLPRQSGDVTPAEA